MDIRPVESYLALGRSGKSACWRYILCFVFITASLLVAQVFFSYIFVGAGHIISFIGSNLAYVIFFLCIWLVIRFLHQRSLLSLLTPAKYLNFANVLFGLLTWLCLNTITALASWLLTPQYYKFSLHMPDFLYFVPLVLLLIPIQSFVEEVFVHGYLLQGLGTIIKNPWLLSLCNGALFMALHLCNPELAINPVIMGLYYLTAGFILAIITIRTNGLEVAIGAHIANNLFAAFIVDDSSFIESNPIYTRTVPVPQIDLAMLILSGLIFYWLVFKFIRR
jgi:uncharacterized protein